MKESRRGPLEHRAGVGTLQDADAAGIADHHPLLADLRALREPKGRTLQVIECLCRPRPRPSGPSQNWRPRLPTDGEVARELGMAQSSVRSHLVRAATWIEGLEALDLRARIYCWYWHQQWQFSQQRSHTGEP